jgi:hypothetical protein
MNGIGIAAILNIESIVMNQERSSTYGKSEARKKPD